MTDRDSRWQAVSITGAGRGRAISDSIGYLLVFSVIIATTGMVYVGGYNSLTEARDFRQMENSERAFEVLATNMEDITLRSAPSRTTELKLSGNTLTFDQGITVEVTHFPTGRPNLNETRNLTLEPLMLRAGPETAVMYSNGAVFRRSPGGTAMVNEPPMVLSQERIMIPIARTAAVGTEQIEGQASTTVAVRADMDGRERLVTNSTEMTLWLNMTTPRADLWRKYIKDHSDSAWRDCPAAENDETTVKCKFTNIENTFVSVVHIGVTYEN